MINFLKLPDIKIFILLLSNRRHFIPILSIYFLLLADTTANQIGIFMAIGHLVSLLIEIPSGYFSDNFGHRKTLILSKIFQILSILMFVSGWFLDSPYNFYIFIFGSIFQALGFSFTTGTMSAFYHEILEKRGEEKRFAEKFGKLKAKVSLISAFLMILFPLSVSIHILMPFGLALILDLVGLSAVIALAKTKCKYSSGVKKSIKELLIEAKNHNLLHVSVFLGLIGGYFVGDTAFRGPYLVELGYPIIWIGLVMGFSRIVWFIVGHYIHYLEKYFSMRQHFFFDMILFSFWYVLIAYFDNPYIVGLTISVVLGYKWGRGALIQSYLLNGYIKDKKYKATFLSINSQFTSIIGMIVSFIAGYVMTYSYEVGYFSLGISLLIFLSISYYFIFRKQKI